MTLRDIGQHIYIENERNCARFYDSKINYEIFCEKLRYFAIFLILCEMVRNRASYSELSRFASVLDDIARHDPQRVIQVRHPGATRVY